MIPPFWNPFKLLDLNHILRTIDDMAQKVCSYMYEWSPSLFANKLVLKRCMEFKPKF